MPKHTNVDDVSTQLCPQDLSSDNILN